MIAAEIRKEELFPVCSPGLLGSPPGLGVPADMRFYTAIRTRSAILGDYWPLWLAEAGVRDLGFAEELVFDLGHVSIQAAVEGLGIMMGSSGLVASDLKGGRLVEPFRIRIPSSSGYYVSIRRESRQGAAEAFRDCAVEHLA
jgi:LysR family glycine cleavage system transcriptional activator